jgi:hypothetical protein
MLAGAPELPANMRITGLRGVGKTVLLEEFGKRAEEVGWEPLYLEIQPAMNTDQALEKALRGLLERGRERLLRFGRLRRGARATLRQLQVKVQWQELSLELALGSQAEHDLAQILFEVVTIALRQQRSGVVLLLDEAQLIRDERDRHGEHPLSLLLGPIIALQRRQLPLALVLCGLPSLTANLQRARSYSERLFRGEEIGTLDHDAALAAFTRPLDDTPRSTDMRVAEKVVSEVEGYPYFVQLWGAELWDAASQAGVDRFTIKLLREILGEIQARLDSDFYKPRLETLTPAERELMIASVSCDYPPLRSSQLAAASPRSPGNINVLLGRLVEAGALYRLRKGEYEYTAPRFREFLLRVANV